MHYCWQACLECHSNHASPQWWRKLFWCVFHLINSSTQKYQIARSNLEKQQNFDKWFQIEIFECPPFAYMYYFLLYKRQWNTNSWRKFKRGATLQIKVFNCHERLWRHMWNDNFGSSRYWSKSSFRKYEISIRENQIYNQFDKRKMESKRSNIQSPRHIWIKKIKFSKTIKFKFYIGTQSRIGK